MLGSKKKFRPTNLRASRKPNEDNRLITSTPNPIYQPTRSIETDNINFAEPSLITNPVNCSEIQSTGMLIVEETDPIFPQNGVQSQTESSSPVSSSPVPGDTGRASSLSSPVRSTDASLAGEDLNLSDEETLVGVDYDNDPRRKEINAKLKAAVRKKDPQLINLLSRPELFDPDRPLDRSSLTMSQLIRLSSIKFREPNAAKDRPDPTPTQGPLAGEDPTHPVDTQPPKPNRSIQVKMVNGQMVVDEESMILPTTSHNTAARSGDVVFEYGLEGQAFQRRQKKTYKVRRWSDQETKRLFIALSQFGTDFTIIQTTLFPNRTREEIKNKFKREEKVHPVRINKALAKKIPVMEYVHLEDLNSVD